MIRRFARSVTSYSTGLDVSARAIARQAKRKAYSNLFLNLCTVNDDLYTHKRRAYYPLPTRRVTPISYRARLIGDLPPTF